MHIHANHRIIQIGGVGAYMEMGAYLGEYGICIVLVLASHTCTCACDSVCTCLHVLTCESLACSCYHTCKPYSTCKCLYYGYTYMYMYMYYPGSPPSKVLVLCLTHAIEMTFLTRITTVSQILHQTQCNSIRSPYMRCCVGSSSCTPG